MLNSIYKIRCLPFSEDDRCRIEIIIRVPRGVWTDPGKELGNEHMQGNYLLKEVPHSGICRTLFGICARKIPLNLTRHLR